MKVRPAFLIALVAASLARPMSAQTPSAASVILDEDGNGSATLFFPGGTTLTGAIPFGLIPANGSVALVYELIGVNGVEGYVGLTEPGTTDLSDVIQFANDGPNMFVTFFSDQDEGVGSLADLAGLPTGVTPDVILPETLLDNGSMGADYGPGFNQPGYITTAGPTFETTYRFISDTVPEPGALAMLAGMSVSGAGFALRRRRRA